jgi:hypothetical protein
MENFDRERGEATFGNKFPPTNVGLELAKF